MGYLLKYDESTKVDNDYKCQTTPKEITFFAKNKIKVVDVVCGQEFSIALDSNGEVYTFGSNSHQQLGQNLLSNYELNPTRMKFDNNIVKIECGWYHGLALNNLGEVFMWGNPLATYVTIFKDIPLPVQIDFQTKIIDIVSGSFHMGAITSDSKLYTWGHNQYV